RSRRHCAWMRSSVRPRHADRVLRGRYRCKTMPIFEITRARFATGGAILGPVAIAAAFVGCGGSDSTSKTSAEGVAKEDVLGAAIAETGAYAAYDASLAAVEQLVKEADAKGGVASAIKQIRAGGVDVPALGPSAFDGTYWLKGIPDTESIYATSSGSIHDPSDAATGRLLRKLKREGVETDILTTLHPLMRPGS